MIYYKPTCDKIAKQLGRLIENSDLSSNLADEYSALVADSLKTWNKIAEDINSSETSLDSAYNTVSTDTGTTSNWAPLDSISTADMGTSTAVNSSGTTDSDTDPLVLAVDSSDPWKSWSPYTIPYSTSTNYTISNLPLIKEPEVTVDLDLTQSLIKAFTGALEAVKDVLHASISIIGTDNYVEVVVDKFNIYIHYDAPRLNMLRRLAESNQEATTQSIYDEISKLIVDQIEVQFDNHKFNN